MIALPLLCFLALGQEHKAPKLATAPAVVISPARIHGNAPASLWCQLPLPHGSMPLQGLELVLREEGGWGTIVQPVPGWIQPHPPGVLAPPVANLPPEVMHFAIGLSQGIPHSGPAQVWNAHFRYLDAAGHAGRSKVVKLVVY